MARPDRISALEVIPEENQPYGGGSDITPAERANQSAIQPGKEG